MNAVAAAVTYIVCYDLTGSDSEYNREAATYYTCFISNTQLCSIQKHSIPSFLALIIITNYEYLNN